MTRLDPIDLAAALIRCPSVTPAEAGALDVLETALAALGFRTRRMPFSEPGTPDVDNLYARHGNGAPHFCFAGHSDVVPVGDAAHWSVDPFGAVRRDGYLLGRGAADMKAAIAAFVAAAAAFIGENGGSVPGSISLLITGDEEGPARNGTKKMLARLRDWGEVPDACVVGEPTCPTRLGETIKIGRRGSLVGELTVLGAAGHSAYPHLADNPIRRLVAMLGALNAATLDDGTDHFQPSTLEITTVDVGNPAGNVIPATAFARFNIRFNDRHTGASLERWLRQTLDAIDRRYRLEIAVSGEAFLTPPGMLSRIVAEAARAETGLTPELSTSGGTSDARFIKDYCPVVEFGMVGETMHKADEKAALADIETLARIYRRVLGLYFAETRAPDRAQG